MSNIFPKVLLKVRLVQFVLPIQLGDQRQSERGKKRKTGTIKDDVLESLPEF